MALRLDDQAQDALNAAKRAVPEDGELDTALMMAALYHHTTLHDVLPAELAEVLAEPLAVRPSAEAKVPVARPLSMVLAALDGTDDPIDPLRLFTALARTPEGRSLLTTDGLGAEDVLGALGLPQDGPPSRRPDGTGWLASPERAKAMETLNAYGRMLTALHLPAKTTVGMESALREVETTLIRMGRRNAVIHGPPGCGKSALVYELARRLADGDPSVPPMLRDHDIFELSPSLLRAGAGIVGEYDKRVATLIGVLGECPKIILFVDELHALLQSGVQYQGPFSQANEAFKDALGKGRISCIGCTTTAEYRQFIEPDGALKRRFDEIKLDEPTPEATLGILRSRVPRLQEHYGGLRIPDPLLERVVHLTEEYQPGMHQPAKSIQLLDRACAQSVTGDSPLEEVTDDVLVQALETTIGRSLVRPGQLKEDDVFALLSSKIVGQDETLRELSSAFVGGFGSWQAQKGPRGRWMFYGPTGVGKTETARLLAGILGGGDREALLRIDCNTLQGSGYDSGPAQNTLLGAPPGYRDHGPGLLSRIRDMPQCIVLLDEIEKADPGVGRVLLQILDEGRVSDATSAVLDFRRAFIVFTTNAGAVYDSGVKHVGFETRGTDLPDAPSVEERDVLDALRATGHGEEFLGRHLRFFRFGALDADALEVIIERQLAGLRQSAQLRGYEFDWAPDLVEYLSAQWQPRFGVRHLTTILRHRIEEQLSVGEAQGELRGVTRIHLEPVPSDSRRGPTGQPGGAARERRDDTLVINLT